MYGTLSEWIRATKGGVISKPLLDMWADRADKLERIIAKLKDEYHEVYVALVNCQTMQGTISDIVLSDRAMSEDEIREQYEAREEAEREQAD